MLRTLTLKVPIAVTGICIRETKQQQVTTSSRSVVSRSFPVDFRERFVSFSSGLGLAGGGVVHGLDQSYPGHTAAGADSGEAAKLREANQELAVRVEKLEAAQERMMLLLEAQAPR